MLRGDVTMSGENSTTDVVRERGVGKSKLEKSRDVTSLEARLTRVS